MIKCPICRKHGISAWRKYCLGPAVPTRCKQCGKKVGVPYSSMMAILPFIVSILISSFVNSLFFGGIIILIGFIITSVVSMKYVPLINMEQKQSGKNIKNKQIINVGKKIFHGILAGIIPSMLLYIMLGYVFIDVQDVTKTSASYGFSFFIIWALFIYWSYRADVVRRIWGRSLLLSAIFSFLLPISMLVFGARVTASQTNAFAVAGSAIGTGIAVVFVGFLMLLLGLAFSLGAYFTYKPLRK